MVIVIDPGHGGHDPGAVGPRGVREKDVVLAVSLRLAELLAPLQVDVKLTREKDQSMTLEERTAYANALGARLLVSIHCNSFTNPMANGVEIWHSYKGDFGSHHHGEAKRIAGILLDYLTQATGLFNRGLKTKLIEQKSSPIYGLDYFAVLRKANCPAMIVELAFISNPHEEALLVSGEFREKVARSLAEGLKTSLNLQPREESSHHSPPLKETTVFFENLQLKGFIVDGRTYVEVRRLAEAIGLAVHWDPVYNRVIITR